MIKKRETQVSEHVARTVRELRKDRRWSMLRLSQELYGRGIEMSPAVVNVLENGVPAQHGYPERKRSVTVDELVVLAEVFEVKITRLLP
jgi:ribosome-binding protein aMBF1 (putative translation factor)